MPKNKLQTSCEAHEKFADPGNNPPSSGVFALQLCKLSPVANHNGAQQSARHRGTKWMWDFVGPNGNDADYGEGWLPVWVLET